MSDTKAQPQQKLKSTWDVTIVGAGLAGSECAYQLAKSGFKVGLIEMRPTTMTPAHKTAFAAELVCSNSFGSQAFDSASGQLKWESFKLDSLILRCGMDNRVPAGQALAVDRLQFSMQVQKHLVTHPNIEIISDQITSLNHLPRPVIIATGPLTANPLVSHLQQHFNHEFLYFFDAIAPIVATDSIDFNFAWRQSRYDKGSADYINCPLTKLEYYQLVDQIKQARKIEPKHFEITPYFEGCMPIEAMVEQDAVCCKLCFPP